MKAFAFRLEQALRWRGEQASLQKSRLSAAVGRAAKMNAALESGKAEARSAAAAVKQSPDGAALSAYAGFAARSKARIHDLEKQTREAEGALAAEMSRLVEANRAVRLLEKLRHTEQDRWRRAFDREIETFAGEAFLHRLQSRKRTGA
jgi:flagellar export protein FliJ